MIFSWGQISLDGPYYHATQNGWVWSGKQMEKGLRKLGFKDCSTQRLGKERRELKETWLSSCLYASTSPHMKSPTLLFCFCSLTPLCQCQVWNIMIWYFYRLHTRKSSYEILTIFPLLYIVFLGFILKIVFWRNVYLVLWPIFWLGHLFFWNWAA